MTGKAEEPKVIPPKKFHFITSILYSREKKKSGI
jgi:hypothetical protein